VLAIGSVVIMVHDVHRAAAFWCGDAADQAAEVERLVALGADRVDWPYPDRPHDFVVLADPDGNRFFVIDTVAE
jgi:hypothetical protein